MSSNNRLKMGYLNFNGKKYNVYKGLNTIGRNREATVIVRDPTVSHQQAILTIVDEQQQFISDVKSSNGTYLNSVRIEPFLLHPISDGCTIKFNDSTTATYHKINDADRTTSNSQDGHTYTQHSEEVFAVNTQMIPDPAEANIQALIDYSGIYNEATQISPLCDIHNVSTQIEHLRPNAPVSQVETQNITTSVVDVHDFPTQPCTSMLRRTTSLEIAEGSSDSLDLANSNIDEIIRRYSSGPPKPNEGNVEILKRLANGTENENKQRSNSNALKSDSSDSLDLANSNIDAIIKRYSLQAQQNKPSISATTINEQQLNSTEVRNDNQASQTVNIPNRRNSVESLGIDDENYELNETTQQNNDEYELQETINKFFACVRQCDSDASTDVEMSDSIQGNAKGNQLGSGSNVSQVSQLNVKRSMMKNLNTIKSDSENCSDSDSQRVIEKMSPSYLLQHRTIIKEEFDPNDSILIKSIHSEDTEIEEADAVKRERRRTPRKRISRKPIVILSSSDSDEDIRARRIKPDLKNSKEIVIPSGSDTEVDDSINFKSLLSKMNATCEEFDDSYVKHPAFTNISIDEIPATQNVAPVTNNEQNESNVSHISEPSFDISSINETIEECPPNNNLDISNNVEELALDDVKTENANSEPAIISDCNVEVLPSTSTDIASNNDNFDIICATQELIVPQLQAPKNDENGEINKNDYALNTNIDFDDPAQVVPSSSKNTTDAEFNFVCPTKNIRIPEVLQRDNTEKKNPNNSCDIDFSFPTQKIDTLGNTFDKNVVFDCSTQNVPVPPKNCSEKTDDFDFLCSTQQLPVSETKPSAKYEEDCDFSAPTQKIDTLQDNYDKDGIFDAATQILPATSNKMPEKGDDFDFLCPTQQISAPEVTYRVDKRDANTASQQTDDDFDFSAPTQKLDNTPKNNTDFDSQRQPLSVTSAKEDDFDFQSPTQQIPISEPNRCDSNTNLNTASKDDFVFSAPFPIVNSVAKHADENTDFDCPTQILPSTSHHASGGDDCDFLAPTQQIPVPQIKKASTAPETINEIKWLRQADCDAKENDNIDFNSSANIILSEQDCDSLAPAQTAQENLIVSQIDKNCITANVDSAEIDDSNTLKNNKCAGQANIDNLDRPSTLEFEPSTQELAAANDDAKAAARTFAEEDTQTCSYDGSDSNVLSMPTQNLLVNEEAINGVESVEMSSLFLEPSQEIDASLGKIEEKDDSQICTDNNLLGKQDALACQTTTQHLNESKVDMVQKNDNIESQMEVIFDTQTLPPPIEDNERPGNPLVSMLSTQNVLDALTDTEMDKSTQDEPEKRSKSKGGDGKSNKKVMQRKRTTRTNSNISTRSSKINKIQLEESGDDLKFDLTIPSGISPLQVSTRTRSKSEIQNPKEQKNEYSLMFNMRNTSKRRKPTSSAASSKVEIPQKRSKTVKDVEVLPERKKRKQKIKVVFTMLDDPKLRSLVKSLGGLVVDTVADCTVLVTQSVLRSKKLLCAIGENIPICSVDWLHKCKEANDFLDPWEHLIVDVEAEARWNFSLKESLNRSKTKLFTNYSFLISIADSNIEDVVKNSITSCGGKVVKRASTTGKFIVVATPETKSKCARYVKQNMRIILPEGVLESVIRQEINFDGHILP